MVPPPAWATGNLSTDPADNSETIWVNGGNWEKCWYANGIFPAAGGVSLFPQNLGERPTGSFRISKAGSVAHASSGTHGVFHAAFNGHPGLPGLENSGYQNSVRYERGEGFVPWVNAAIYTGNEEDNYVGLGTDNSNPEAAYLALDSHSMGIIVNVWNGTNMMYSLNDPLKLAGTINIAGHRWSPQWSPAIEKGAWLCYINGGMVTVCYISPDGAHGSPTAICAGNDASIATDKSGFLHIVYMNGGQTCYRRVTTKK